MKTLDSTKHFSIIGGNAAEGINGSQYDYTPVVKVQIGSVEGKVEACCVGLVVQRPLGHGTNNSQAISAGRKTVIGLGHRLSLLNCFTCLINLLTNLSTEVSNQTAQFWAYLCSAKKTPQLRMRGLQKIFTNVGKKVLVTGQNRNVYTQLENKRVNSRCYSAPHIPHRCTGRAKSADYIL